MIGLLAKASMFAHLPATDLEILAAAASQRTLANGEVALAAGEVNHGLFVVMSGQVKVTRRIGKEDVPLATLDPGHSFGEMSMIDGSMSSATVTAQGSTEVICIPGAAIETLFARTPEVAARFWRQVAVEMKRRLLATNDLVANYVDVSRALVEDPAFREYYSTL